MNAPGPALRYHGGKFRLAPWILAHLPPHRVYVEPYGGAAGVLLNKPRAYAEVWNDLDGEVVNFFQVLRDRRADLVEACALTPYAREEFELAWAPSEDPVERARRLCVRAQMGFGSAGATKGQTGFRVDCCREYGTAQHLWARYPDSLACVGARFQGVLIEHRPALEVLQEHDGAQTLHYVDPPYLHALRVMRGHGYYRHEMNDADHQALLECLLGLEGMVVLSGYPNPLYDATLAGWQTRETSARIAAGRGTTVRAEKLWLNPAAVAAMQAGSLFAGL